jgi:hypothetical protein
MTEERNQEIYGRKRDKLSIERKKDRSKRRERKRK